MNAAKTTVAEYHHHVATLRVLANVIYDGIRVRQIDSWLAACADLLQELFRI